jgi:hypothetical protein
MIILIHVLIALASIGFTTYLYFSPSKGKLYTAYGLIALTIASGTYLIIGAPSHMVESCTMGLTYLALVSVGILAARKKLAQPTL